MKTEIAHEDLRFKLAIIKECHSISDVIIDAHFHGLPIPKSFAVAYRPLLRILSAYDAHGRFLLDSAVAELNRSGTPVRYDAFAAVCDDFFLEEDNVKWVQVAGLFALLIRTSQMARDGGWLKIQLTYFKEYIGRFLTENDNAFEFLREFTTQEGAFINMENHVEKTKTKTMFYILEFTFLAIVTVLNYL